MFELKETKAFTDSGTSCIMGPSLMIRYIKDTVLDLLPRYYQDLFWSELFDCDFREYLPSFYLLFGNHWFEVRPEDYAVEVTLNGMCALCLQERLSDEYWVLGVAFMRGWYSIHDHELMRFGFVPFVDSPKEPPRLESLTPMKQLPEEYLPLDDGGAFNWRSFLQGYVFGIIFCMVTIAIVIEFCIQAALCPIKTKSNKTTKFEKEDQNITRDDTTVYVIQLL